MRIAAEIWVSEDALQNRARLFPTSRFNGESDTAKQVYLHVSNTTCEPITFDYPVIAPFRLAAELPHCGPVIFGIVEVVGQHTIHKLPSRRPAALLSSEIGELVSQSIKIWAGITGDEQEYNNGQYSERDIPFGQETGPVRWEIHDGQGNVSQKFHVALDSRRREDLIESLRVLEGSFVAASDAGVHLARGSSNLPGLIDIKASRHLRGMWSRLGPRTRRSGLRTYSTFGKSLFRLDCPCWRKLIDFGFRVEMLRLRCLNS